MAGKKLRSKYTSKGERRSSMKTSGVGVTSADKFQNKINALAKGKRVVFTEERNGQMVRVAYDYKNPRGVVVSKMKSTSGLL